MTLCFYHGLITSFCIFELYEDFLMILPMFISLVFLCFVCVCF